MTRVSNHPDQLAPHLRVIRPALGAPLLAALLLAACSGNSTPQAAGKTTSLGPTIAAAPTASPDASTDIGVPAMGAPTANGALAERTGVLTNPANSQVVFLYYDLAGIPPPIDAWVEQDNRVEFAPTTQKAEQRAQVKAELLAGLAAVKDIGVLQLHTDARVSQYDPTYGEFTIGALSPASEYTFDALGSHVAVKFDNGLDAQTWSVPKAESQGFIDKTLNRTVNLDVVLRITKVLPAPVGGTLVTHIESWALRDAITGTTIAKVAVARK